MGHHEVVFPEAISYGSTGGPGFNTAILETDSGREERVQRWSAPRWRFDVSKGLQKYEDLSLVLAFFQARGGAANSFNYKNPIDYTSSPTDPSFRGPGAGVRDQLIGTGDGATTTFQLGKTYLSGPASQFKPVVKPITGSVRVWVDGTEKTVDVDFTVDTTTGIVTFGSAPGVGLDVEASFEYYLPVRFDRSVDQQLLTNIRSFGGGAMPGIDLVEVFDEDPPHVDLRNFGGEVGVVFGSDLQLSTEYYVWSLEASTSGLSVKLPDPTDLPLGGDHLVLVNVGSEDFAVKTHDDSSVIAAVAEDEAVEFILALTAGGGKVWLGL